MHSTASDDPLAGHDFLCIDVNGDVQYRMDSGDIANDITGYTGTLGAGDFVRGLRICGGTWERRPTRRRVPFPRAA